MAVGTRLSCREGGVDESGRYCSSVAVDSGPKTCTKKLGKGYSRQLKSQGGSNLATLAVRCPLPARRAAQRYLVEGAWCEEKSEKLKDGAQRATHHSALGTAGWDTRPLLQASPKIAERAKRRMMLDPCTLCPEGTQGRVESLRMPRHQLRGLCLGAFPSVHCLYGVCCHSSHYMAIIDFRCWVDRSKSHREDTR